MVFSSGGIHLSSETEVVVTPSGYRAFGKENLTPVDLYALLASNQVASVRLRIEGEPDYEIVGKAIYGLHRIGVKLRIGDDAK
ncbi:MAG: hypothetical protein ACXW2U_13890 [Telluria sp.]